MSYGFLFVLCLFFGFIPLVLGVFGLFFAPKNTKLRGIVFVILGLLVIVPFYFFITVPNNNQYYSTLTDFCPNYEIINGRYYCTNGVAKEFICDFEKQKCWFVENKGVK